MAQYRKYPVKDLVVDPAYQRDLDEKRVQKIADEYDEALFGVLEVSKRNGSNKAHVFDGQHRLAAATLMGLTTVPTLVHAGLGQRDEAGLFVRLQQQRKTLSPLQKFKARLVAGDPVAEEITQTAANFGFRIDSDSDAPNTIGAVAALDRIYLRGGTVLLADTLHILAAWKGEPKGRNGDIVDGVARTIEAYREHPKYEQLVQTLITTPPAVLHRKAVGMVESGGGSISRPTAVAKQAGLLVGIKGPYKKRTKAAKA